MRILVKTKDLRYDVRKTYVADFWNELKNHADVTLSYEGGRGKYDVVIGGSNSHGLAVRVMTDIHGKGVTTEHPVKYVARALNSKSWNIILMRYVHINYPGVPKTFYEDNVKAKVAFFPWSLCEKRWGYSEIKNNDVLFLGSTGADYYPLRAIIRKALPLPYKTISGNMSMEAKRDPIALQKDNAYPGEYIGEKYIKALQQSKIILTDASVYGCPVKKYFEAMATGCLLLADKPNHADEIGLVDGETYVEVSKDNWREKLDYYLANDAERLRITRNARDLFESRHTNKVRAKQLIELLK